MCSSYQHADSSYKEQIQDRYEAHIQNKNPARENKAKDKDNAKCGDQNIAVACFDLQEVLSTPKGFESCLYYKRKLSSYNFSIYDLVTSEGYCYVWNETIAGRGSSEMSSCVF